MLNELYAHGGGPPEGADIFPAGKKIAGVERLRKYFSITNASSEPMYIALHTSEDGSCPAEVGKGIYLAPNGGVMEINATNAYHGEIWITHGGAGAQRVCIQRGT